MKIRIMAPAVVGAAALALVVAGCGGGDGDNTKSTGASTQGAGGSGQGTQPLNIGMPNGPVKNISNPFLNTSAGAALGYTNVIYEPLMQINDTKPADPPTPWLAKSMEWNKDYTEVKITPRDGVKFSDGTPMTADDIAYSIQLRIDNEALNTEGLPYKSVTNDGGVITVTFKSSQFVNQAKVYGLIVVPKHIWSQIKDPTKDLVQNPVGTGPYVFKNFSGQTVTLDANKDYWGGELAVPELRYTGYSGNDPQIAALQTGQSDWSWVFIADYENVYVAKDPDHNKVYSATGLGIDQLVLNNEKGAFSDINLRKALNMVLDREKAAKIAESGLFPQLTSVTGIPTPAGDTFIADKYKGQNYSIDVDGAKKQLTDNGYTYSGDKLMKDGKQVSVVLQDPAGWNDYITSLQLIATSLKSIGVDAKVETPTVDAWTANLNTGDFDAALHWTDGGSTPYQMYSSMFDPNYYVPLGKNATWDIGRYNNPDAKKTFDEYIAATDDTARKAAMDKLQDFWVNDVPAIGVDARPSAAEYSTKNYVGWPDEQNPYADPQPTNKNASLILTKLKPAS
ncbi:peptide ABC transporter substrate-binding protein [Luteimicrobium album]|uniref:Peptide ABC transporter substrate-binding protein n=1 Tax=Luteimicrobium album TaxID=1054550 RepID=A0ABQ6HYC0_9MICO|nr:ABC transporter substrate-binding protein [Luteimicrobium album]GMA22982.1 peptide ABC transporter substrate-binding protein [Luteimicrobium album]